ncbi:type IV secretion protein Rhs [Photobacterium jeanii]|uniref:Type IV secretion protein Rhs n=1 Tax=Photobacterium jeanii TaxID=858640 RepID=A0A178KKM7_9GAMM|nr:type VI secretion system tip protein TssI/VgrG [Photobacterium jeanii]OAN17817.1 type IV secretion protein Rhs [Photobacterium jeanii]PST92517.1 type VI secretion system tip protein VgrG [Photobacterium jeanii]
MTSVEYKEEQRPILATIDGKGPYIVIKLKVCEKLSDPASYCALLTTTDPITESVLGKTLDINYSPGFEGLRKEAKRFYGIVSSIENVKFDINKQLYTYKIEGIDPFSILTFRSSSQVFQDMTTKQIVEKVLSSSGFKSHFKLSMRSAGIKHSYCIQFNETDSRFLQRLLASEGWHYHVDHSSKKPLVIIGDSNQDFKTIEGNRIPFVAKAKDKRDAISEWHFSNKLGASKLSLADFNHETADVLDSGERSSSSKSKVSALSHHFFGQGISDKSTTRDAAKKQMERIDSQKVLIHASSTNTAINCGQRFKLTDHTESDYNQEYVITQATHWITADEGVQQAEYRNEFQCVPSSLTWRPEFIAKPAIYSVQSAIVTGPKNEETNQDNLGRIKVHFHWDKDGQTNEKSSCWVPVAQATASNGFGIQFIPRVGDQVLVSFIDGDPDRPVVSGSIYTKKNKPPYSTATQSGIKTRTTPNGNSSTANELRFEDKKDKEEIYLQAEKDLTVNVKKDKKQTIAGLATMDVTKTLAIKSKEAMSFETEDTLSNKAAKDISLTSDASVTAKASKNAEISASSKVTIDGQTIELKGKTKIKLSVGANAIEISQSGIKISGTQVTVDAKGTANLKGTMVAVEGKAKADFKGAIVGINGSAMTQVKAGAMVQIQGAIAKVN